MTALCVATSVSLSSSCRDTFIARVLNVAHRARHMRVGVGASLLGSVPSASRSQI